MKAVQINSYGGVDVLEVVENAAKPTLSKEQVLIEVHAAGINPVDWKLREGYLKEWMPITFPATLGGDVSGVVTEIGEGVGDFKVGDEIFGQGGLLNGGSGSFAQFAAANTGKIVLKPKNLDFDEAGALPLAGISALQALEDHIHLKKDQKILIHGGAGGIGTMAIQMAKYLGAYVATTVSADDIEYVKGLGADEAIDYKQSFSSNKSDAFEDKLSNFDAVFDTVGGEITDRSFKVLKKGGIIVSMTGAPSEELAKKHEVTAIGQGTDVNHERLNRLAELADSGKLKVNIDKVFSLNEAKETFLHLEEGHPRGKVVLRIKD